MTTPQIDNSENCKHTKFKGTMKVVRFSDSENFFGEVSVVCEECGIPLQFVGIPFGLSFTEPTVSPDRQEARFPLCFGVNNQFTSQVSKPQINYAHDSGNVGPKE